MKLEFLLQFIVPLTFLAIWALTSLLNRDAQPLPPRPGAGRGPGVGTGAGRGRRGILARRAGRPDAGARVARSPGVPDAGPVRAGAMVLGDRARTAFVRPDAGRRRGDRDHRIRVGAAQGSSSFSPSSAASGGRATRATSPASRKAAASRPLDARARQADRAGTAADPDRPGRPVPGSEAFQAAGDRPALDADDADLVGAADLGLPDARPRGGRAPPPRRTIRASPSTTSAPCSTSPKRLREVALLGELLQPPVSLRAPRRPR